MKHSNKFALLSYFPNAFSSFLYLYLSANFDYNFPFSMVIPSMIIIFTLTAILIKFISLPIDIAVKEFDVKSIISDESLRKFKKAQFNLTQRVHIFLMSAIIITVYVINLAFGKDISYLFNIKYILEVAHILGIFSMSFIAQTAIFNSYFSKLRKKFNVTNIENDRLFNMRGFLFLVSSSFIFTIGATFAYYSENITSETFFNEEYVDNLTDFYQNTEFDKKISALLKISEIQRNTYSENLKIQNEYLKKIQNSNINDFDKEIFIHEGGYLLLIDKLNTNAFTLVVEHQEFFVSFMLLFTFYAYFIIYFIAKGMRTQISSINSSVEEILTNNSEVNPLPICEVSEISSLTNSFNKLLGHLKEKNFALKDLNLELEYKVEERTHELQEKNEKIIDSIEYAKTIQESALPTYQEINTSVKDNFALWKPRDIVGGDFYWFKKTTNGCFIALIDCTGHGVPGALMTMMVNAYLNNFDTDNITPAEIISELNTLIKNTINKDKNKYNDNGLDIGVCYIDNRNDQVIYSGAKIDLYYSDSNGINTIKADKQSVGYIRSKIDFTYTNHTLEKKGYFYMSTDGFYDQNSDTKVVFGKKKFKLMLEEVSKEKFELQSELISEVFNEFKGDSLQRDDVTVVAFSI